MCKEVAPKVEPVLVEFHAIAFVWEEIIQNDVMSSQLMMNITELGRSSNLMTAELYYVTLSQYTLASLATSCWMAITITAPSPIR